MNSEKEFNKIKEKILTKIGKPVKFTYPNGMKLNGVLKDRVVMHTRSITQMKDFFDVIDLSAFNVEGEIKEAIRFGYYIYENKRLRWGSQTTLTEEKTILLDLFKKAYKKQWFKQFIAMVIGND